MNKQKLPENICFIASLCFIILAIPNVLLLKPLDVGSITMPIYFGLFLFLLSLVLTNIRFNDELKERVNNLELKKENNISHD